MPLYSDLIMTTNLFVRKGLSSRSINIWKNQIKWRATHNSIFAYLQPFQVFKPLLIITISKQFNLRTKYSKNTLNLNKTQQPQSPAKAENRNHQARKEPPALSQAPQEQLRPVRQLSFTDRRLISGRSTLSGFRFRSIDFLKSFQPLTSTTFRLSNTSLSASNYQTLSHQPTVFCRLSNLSGLSFRSIDFFQNFFNHQT